MFFLMEAVIIRSSGFVALFALFGHHRCCSVGVWVFLIRNVNITAEVTSCFCSDSINRVLPIPIMVKLYVRSAGITTYV